MKKFACCETEAIQKFIREGSSRRVEKSTLPPM